MTEKVTYGGIVYRVQTSGRYFQCSAGKNRERLLHRRVWIDHHGEIPADHEVHHINGDWRDNRLENLKCVERFEHQSAHMRERWQDPEKATGMRTALATAISRAPQWHRSEDGKAWHREHARKQWDNAKQVECGCRVCGAKFMAWMRDATLCSKKCASREAYLRYRTATKNCPHCGKQFTYNKYRSQECCSRGCSIRRRNGL